MISRQISQMAGMALGVCLVVAAAQIQAFEAVIQVAPGTLNIGSSSEVVTVHTDVAYGDVVAYSVQLNGVPIQSWKADDRGNFVAKFDSTAVKSLDGLAIGGDNELILIGATTDGDSFVGSDWIRVIDILPRKR
ncbi:hypothetical protein [Thiocapsa marina]|uniref:Uncharacterized protein n=1 Tax=Thiocapsa marina 5811 TaxID=768671 RepID=F9UHE8_9GAMM|nr:hypothetical protein [Thiocapsa marina]EGV16406.1 hypothetical protein ThimaDRAFT_4351 [Thiocapsa marina 5811]